MSIDWHALVRQGHKGQVQSFTGTSRDLLTVQISFPVEWMSGLVPCDISSQQHVIEYKIVSGFPSHLDRVTFPSWIYTSCVDSFPNSFCVPGDNHEEMNLEKISKSMKSYRYTHSLLEGKNLERDPRVLSRPQTATVWYCHETDLKVPVCCFEWKGGRRDRFWMEKRDWNCMSFDWSSDTRPESSVSGWKGGRQDHFWM